MQYIYTAHALERMQLRNVTEAMVIKTIESPEETGKGYRNRDLAFRTFPEGRLKVVLAREGTRVIIITIIWERKEI
ncbi:MAG: DUF4258 domain-containing protein [Candidatus Brocadiaceae bacterium]|nr:DUF4258 domain-containing protein [Candidatus Brocadiaceae bacterium]